MSVENAEDSELNRTMHSLNLICSKFSLNFISIFPHAVILPFCYGLLHTSIALTLIYCTQKCTLAMFSTLKAFHQHSDFLFLVFFK